MRRSRHLGRTIVLVCALAVAISAAAPVANAEAAGCGFLGLYPCAAPVAGQPATVSCGFLGLQRCLAPGSSGGSASGRTVPCGFLNLSRCPVPADPPPTAPPTPTAPDPGGNESANVPTPPPGGRYLGFNSGLFDWANTAETEVGLERIVGANAQRYAIHWGGMQRTATAPPIPNGNPPLGQAPEGSELDRYDTIYEELVSHGMKPVILVIATPKWATPYANCFILDFNCLGKQSSQRLYPDAAHIPDWKRFATAIAARYPQAVFEGWNEPNLKSFWGGDMPNPAHMTKLQCAAHEGIKALPAPNTVISPGLAVFTTARGDGSPLFKDYLKTMYQNGLRACMDGHGAHMYPANINQLGPESPFAKVWQVLREVRAQFGDTSPVWVTETGSASSRGTSDPYPLSEAEQSSLNTRMYNRMATMPEVKAIIFHTLRDAPVSSLSGQTSRPDYHFGFLRENWTPKPVFCAFAAKAGHTYAGC